MREAPWSALGRSQTFCHIQQLAVFKLRRPLHLDECAHFVLSQEVPHANWNVLIE
ncbi:MAG TPA: hypothetical protein VKM93_26370 [Terriglobia bacterium]|nr:hypothetical protein [Terriglobia bacterium]